VPEPRGTSIASVVKAFTALAEIADRPGSMTAKDVAAAMGAPLPTTYHMLNTLVEIGALVKADKHGFLLGPRIGALGDAYLEQGEPILLLEPAVRELALRTGETAYLSAWRHGEIEVVVTVPGTHPVRVAQLPRGTHGFAHARASGKVMLAFARPGLREDFLKKNPLEKLTANTIDNADALTEELEAVARRGYAFDLEEFVNEVSCVAGPIMSSGHIVAALTVSAPTARFEKERDMLVEALTDARRMAERLIAGE
jgi:IclR family transcriptional regulator, acetate operon repressor